MDSPKLPAVDALVQKLRGFVGVVGGQTWNINRLSDASNGAVATGTPIATGYLAKIERTSSKLLIENATFDLLTFIARGDNTNLEIFDLCTATGYGAEPLDIYSVVSMRPTLQTLWMRCEYQAIFTRPTPLGGAAAQQPASGPIVAPSYLGITKKNELPLTLIDGVYAFATDPQAVPAVVQVGIQAIRRVRDDSSMADVPSALYRADFLAWAPTFAGAPLKERDRITVPGLGRFQIAAQYSSGTTGLAGSILVIEKAHR